MSVARSMKKRDKMPIIKGLSLWYWYNILAIQNSKDLCVVTTSNAKVMANPYNETILIVHDLTMKCGVVPPPKQITRDIVHNFVNPNLQHDKRRTNTAATTTTPLSDDCNNAAGWDVLYPKQSDVKIFKMAMDLYCKFEAGIYK